MHTPAIKQPQTAAPAKTGTDSLAPALRGPLLMLAIGLLLAAYALDAIGYTWTWSLLLVALVVFFFVGRAGSKGGGKGTSAAGPLVLLLLGTGALFVVGKMNPSLPLLEYVGNYWPFLVVIWSGIRVAQVLVSKTASKQLPSRGISGGEWFLALLLLVVGVGLHVSRAGFYNAIPLPSGVKYLRNKFFPAKAAGEGSPDLARGVKIPPSPKRPNPLDKITALTDANLINPPVGDWLNWRRTYDDAGFSPLTQITKANVSNLTVAWAWSLPSGPNEATPLAHDGVVFVHGSGDTVQAIDGVTGDPLWKYSRELPDDTPASVKRNMALYDDKLYLATSDSHMVALAVKTGKVVWDHSVGDPKQGVRMTGGPLVAKGKVMIGTIGRVPGGNYIMGMDAQTGQEAWRFYVIARPDEPGGNSWNGLALEKRNGASIWTAGSYDPTVNLAYFGTGQTYDTAPLLHPVNKPGVTNDGLYTDSTIALNPDTGKLVWYFQHQPNDQWDLDWAFERQVVSVTVNGETKRLVATVGKEAILDVVEAATGKYVYSMDFGLQNVITSIDPKTGAKTADPTTLPGSGKSVTICPYQAGGKSWTPASFNPNSKVAFVPLVESCMTLAAGSLSDRAQFSTGVRWFLRPPANSDGQYGRLQAVNLETRQVVWTNRQRMPLMTGMLATAGGVVFAGSLDRYLAAYDDSTGKELWKTRLNDVPNSAPITYSVNGKQYLAVVVGNGGVLTQSYTPLLPEVHNPTAHTSSLWVFELSH